MKIKVLVVDDSSFFRRRVSEIINADPEMEVIDTAINGEEAITKAKSLRPDVITMDIEMPVLDGISAVKVIMKENPTPILMFSSLTHQGAKSTLEALEAGAANFLPKKFEDIAKDKAEAVKLLQQNIKEISKRRSVLRTPRAINTTATHAAPVRGSIPTSTRSNTINSSTANKSIMPSSATNHSATDSRINKPTLARHGTDANRLNTLDSRHTHHVDNSPSESRALPTASRLAKRASGKKYALLAIGSSTGGPVALQNVLTPLRQNFPLPILLIQHMPATFTSAFAARLNTLCQIKVKEAQHGDRLLPGVAYLAPGGKQVLIESKAGGLTLKVMESPEGINYKPSVDITFGSAAKSYRDKVLAVVLTGMGADGREGAKLLKQHGSTIWAQDAQSCVVYGMPQAIVNAGLADEQINLLQIAERINIEVGCR
ncbi:chemotaxis response regulator protein-glutamate methylesterase [Moritella sp. F3]|uniref:protein-glutamate methylesterase/protein-glutamine glutaminase n=1 Tax=Moritella sp. F3 TaxID=2718882 RepID=UPI0018E1588F|nr:chemotaxis response regulator protein-glutamate methylesterase [Moritella sp. F3]GIC78033.1 chemotaxis response regulator protein-glutamate methylesterase of group 1 operon [Moritella sp. F1]GIC82566.1 chemotaxis response regulator protein-glutamate methylesterase of group 1 operon [Moritella sp. F3]